MPNYWGGLVEGFQGRRETEEKKNYERELQNRQFADRVFTYLLQSRDAPMQEMALKGLMSPTGKQKGFKGFMGGMENTSDPIYASMVARMNEMIPDDRPAAPGPAAPAPSTASGSAAMSTNQMTTPGAAPPQMPGTVLPPEPPPAGDAMSGISAAMPPDQDLMGPQAVGMPPPPPPESKWKRRGTGVPTAEEVAEMTAESTLRGRIHAATTALGGLGASPEEQRRAAMGIAGAPQSANQFDAQNFGVKVTGPDGVSRVVPVSMNRATGTYHMPDGKPLPPGAEMVRMAGSSSAGALTSKIPDDARGRQYLIENGADPAEVNAGSPTGYWKLVTKADGTVGVQADMYTPPALFSPTTILDTQGNAVTAPFNNRTGRVGPPMGNAPGQAPSSDQSAAQGLLAAVQQRIAAESRPRLGGITKPIPSARRDQIVKEEAAASNLPYTSFVELQTATRLDPRRQVAPRPDAPAGGAPVAPAGDLGSRLRERLLQRQKARQGGPPRPPVRAGGPGPVGR